MSSAKVQPVHACQSRKFISCDLYLFKEQIVQNSGIETTDQQNAQGFAKNRWDVFNLWLPRVVAETEPKHILAEICKSSKKK